MNEQATRPCRDCGKPLPMGPKGGGPRRCLECGMRAGLANVAQMRQKSGPAWERWRQGVRAAAER